MAARRLAAPAVTSLLTMIACGVLAAPSMAAAPTNNTLPGIQGTAQNGQVLTEVEGIWTGGQPTSVIWEDCANSDGTGCNPIAGAPTTPGSTYTLTDSDLGQYIVVQETATADDGSSDTAEASSMPVGPVGPPANLSPPSITASQDGRTLTELAGSWTPNASVTVQWYDCPDGSGNISSCNPSGPPTAPGSSYTLANSDRGKYIAVRETASAGGVSSADSAAVAPSTTTLTPPAPNPAVTNQVVTFAATITSAPPDGVLSGSVTFWNGGTAISGCTNEAVSTSSQSATVICQASFPASAPQLDAVFTPDGSTAVLGSATTGAKSLTVGQDTSTTSLDVSSTVDVGQSTTYTATVAPPNVRPGPVQPSGSVEFFDGGQPIGACANQPVINGGATCAVTYAAPGTHAITARYGGDANFVNSASASQTLTVVTPPAPPPPASPTSSPPPAQQVLGTIAATMQWTFNFSPQYTKVMALVLNGAHQTTVTVRCAGRGCPFRRHAIAVGAAQRCRKHMKRRCSSASGLNLTRIFRSRHLRVGTRITVAITKPSWIGKYYLFTIRSGHGPGVRIGCLAPGATRPGGRC